jgi:hypothetical protein
MVEDVILSENDLQLKQSMPEPGQFLHGESFFSKLFPFLFGDDVSAKVRKKLLKQILKKMRQVKPRIYNNRNDTAEPALAKYFYQFYRTLGPARTMLQTAETSKVLEAMVIESSLGKDQMKIIENISDEKIRARAETKELKGLAEELKNEMKEIIDSIKSNAIKDIRNIHGLLNLLLDLIRFDYFFLLKKFDPKMPEADFTYKPSFDSIDSKYIVEELKDIIEIVPVFDTKANWHQILDIIKDYKGMDIVSRKEWDKFLQTIEKIKRTKLFEMMVQLIEGDPSYQPNLRMYNENIIQSYLSNLKTQVDLTLQRISRENRTKKVEILANKVFGAASVSRLSNYTEKANEWFVRKAFSGYTHVSALNYLKAFLLDFCKKDVRELVDLLLIKGRWLTGTSAVSGVIYDAFQKLLRVSRELLGFDDSLAEEEEVGRRIKAAAIQSRRSVQNEGSIHRLLREANDTAKQLILRGARNCIDLARAFRSVLEDHEKKSSELLLNWGELDSMIEHDLKEMIVGIYMKLYSFIQLLKLLQSK